MRSQESQSTLTLLLEGLGLGYRMEDAWGVASAGDDGYIRLGH